MSGTDVALTEENSRLCRRIEAVNVETKSLRTEIKDLKAENEDLRERLSKYEDPQPPKNSTNSSVPPSKERIGDEIKRRTTSLREKSGKKPGGHPGHDDATKNTDKTVKKH